MQCILVSIRWWEWPVLWELCVPLNLPLVCSLPILFYKEVGAIEDLLSE